MLPATAAFWHGAAPWTMGPMFDRGPLNSGQPCDPADCLRRGRLGATKA